MQRGQRRNTNILIAGYYGFDLLGDEAILQAMLSDLRGLSAGVRFTVTSQWPEATSAMGAAYRRFAARGR